MKRLEGRVAVVTGAAMGIGRSVALAFADEGAWVIAADIAEFGNPGHPRIQQVSLNVAREDDWDRVITSTLKRFGRIDVLVGAAGIIGYDALVDTELSEWNRVVSVDQTGVFLGMRAVIPSMVEAGKGSIINISSAWGVVGGVGVAAYNAAKGAVRSLSRNAAVTYATQGVRVNTMIPGWIHTPLTDRQPQEANERVVGSTPMGRGGFASEIADGCVFLASDESSFVTGADFVVDGGLLAV